MTVNWVRIDGTRYQSLIVRGGSSRGTLNRPNWESPELGIARTGNRPSWESTELVAPAYFLTFPALTLLPAFRPSPIFLASSLRTAAYFGATIG